MGYFDIGSGIDAGEMEELVWDKSTDNGNCEWIFKAISPTAKNPSRSNSIFCEKNLVLEFK